MKTRVPIDGEIGIITAFLFFPKIIGAERRWWETATWKRVFIVAEGEAFWKDVEWINTPDSASLKHQK